MPSILPQTEGMVIGAGRGAMLLRQVQVLVEMVQVIVPFWNVAC
jgi:hypothetical protein